uniref:Uncharacterized protein n=1 Tax=Dendrocoelum lacteum TaxID=27895 RepID=T1DF83_9PLAT
MTFLNYSDIHFDNMESMVSSSIKKYRIQSASNKEPNLLHKLLITKMIGKLKAILFDPDFISGQEIQKCKENVNIVNKETSVREVGEEDKSESTKCTINSQLQCLLKRRIAAKRKRSMSDGEVYGKVKRGGETARVLSTETINEPPPSHTPPTSHKSPPRLINSTITLFIPIKRWSNSRQ